MRTLQARLEGSKLTTGRSAPGTIVCNFDEPEERSGKRKRTSEAGNKGGKVAALEAKIGKWELSGRPVKWR